MMTTLSNPFSLPNGYVGTSPVASGATPTLRSGASYTDYTDGGDRYDEFYRDPADFRHDTDLRRHVKGERDREDKPYKLNGYQHAMVDRSARPWYERIGLDAAAIAVGAIASGLILGGARQLPAVRNALNHPNGFVRFFANIAHRVADFAILDAVFEGVWRFFSR